jgi:hypothetical protein
MKTLILLAALAVVACDEPTTDDKQAAIQEQSLEQAHAAIGMPATPNFQERRTAKDLYELRDKSIATHAYIVNEMTGCLIYLGPAVGYGLPYATQYTSPTRTVYHGTNGGYFQVPQAEPNGLFMPATAEGTWVMLKDPKGEDVKPVYIEPRVIVSPFRLDEQECKKAPEAKEQNGLRK